MKTKETIGNFCWGLGRGVAITFLELSWWMLILIRMNSWNSKIHCAVFHPSWISFSPTVWKTEKSKLSNISFRLGFSSISPSTNHQSILPRHPSFSPCIYLPNHLPSLHPFYYHLSSLHLFFLLSISIYPSIHLSIFPSFIHPSILLSSICHIWISLCQALGIQHQLKYCPCSQWFQSHEKGHRCKQILIVPCCAGLRRVVASGEERKEVGYGMRSKRPQMLCTFLFLFKKY